MRIRDLHTDQSSLEEIFVGLVNEPRSAAMNLRAVARSTRPR